MLHINNDHWQWIDYNAVVKETSTIHHKTLCAMLYIKLKFPITKCFSAANTDQCWLIHKNKRRFWKNVTYCIRNVIIGSRKLLYYFITIRNHFSSYRQSASPLHEETHKFAQDYHMKSVAEKRMSSNSPSFNDRNSPSYPHRTSSPNYPQRTASPSYVRASSPNYPSPGRDSPDFITSKRLNEKRYEFANSSLTKNKSDFDSNYATKMSSMRISDSRSPSYMERWTNKI